jgi:hypothetical protein
MTFRNDSADREGWRDWTREHRDELISTGVPIEIYSDRIRWIRFLEEGADYQKGFFTSQLNRVDAAALFQLIRREYGNESYRGLLRQLETAYPGIDT